MKLLALQNLADEERTQFPDHRDPKINPRQKQGNLAVEQDSDAERQQQTHETPSGRATRESVGRDTVSNANEGINAPTS